MNRPKFPIYVISKGRADTCLTARFFIKDKCPFYLVIEPQEYDEYTKHFDKSIIKVLPFSNLGLGSIPARNWCWEDAKLSGHERHWIFDDNIYRIRRWYKKLRVPCDSNIALKVCEDFVNRYENIGIAGLNYSMFAVPVGSGHPPFFLNCHVYSSLLIDNNLPVRWRGRYNEDTDLCLQVLSLNLCTVLFNAFTIDKVATMTMKGGNMEKLYKGDGRLKMARALERVWPRVAKVSRKFNRPQHVVFDNWKRFDTLLKLKPGIDLSKLPPIDNYGMQVTEIKPVQNSYLKSLVNGETK